MFALDWALASEHGINVAVVAAWIAGELKKDSRYVHFVDGQRWLRLAIKEFTQEIPCLSKPNVRTAVDKLVELGTLQVAYMPTHNFDKRKSYTLG